MYRLGSGWNAMRGRVRDTDRWPVGDAEGVERENESCSVARRDCDHWRAKDGVVRSGEGVLCWDQAG
jgi:hypothetical protein